MIYATSKKEDSQKQFGTLTFESWMESALQRYAEERVFFVPSGVQEGWTGRTFQDVYDSVRGCARMLIEAGVSKGTVVAFLAPNSLEWEIVHHACLLIGAIVLGVDFHAQAEHQNAILKDSRPACFVIDQVKRLDGIDADLWQSKKIILLENPKETPLNSCETYFLYEKNFSSSPPVDYEVKEYDPAILIYTSGTTGQPKGVLYTQKQLILALEALQDCYGDELSEIPVGERVIACWMPLSNLFQRMVDLLALDSGFKIYYCSDPTKLVTLLPEIRPSVLIGVPRLFEKIAQQAMARISFLPRIIRPLAVRYLVGRVVRKKLGGRIRFLAVGSAKTPGYVLDFFQRIGLRLYEIYGMSENIIPMSGNNRTHYREGSVGRPLKYNAITVGDDGEIFLESPGLGARWGQTPMALSETQSKGPLATGDIGSLDKDGYLYVEGRKDNVIKTSTGVRVLCDEIEEKFLSIPGIEQFIVIGRFQKLLTAVAVSTLDLQALVKNVNRVNETLPGRYRIYGLLVTRVPFSPLNGLTTPNLKIKRRKIEEVFAFDLRRLYEDVESAAARTHELREPLIRKIS